MGYIEDMRALIGHRPLILVGSCVLILDDQDRLLLQLRTDNRFWGILGGGMEPGETVEETARREVREETALEVETLEFFGVFSGQEFCYQYPNGDQVCDVNIVYIADRVKGQLRADPDETLELRYFPLDQLPANMNPPDRPILDQFVAQRGKGNRLVSKNSASTL
jgi:8-oxo-dGTP pyrophosphatase MutT (NUDIX family)